MELEHKNSHKDGPLNDSIEQNGSALDTLIGSDQTVQEAQVDLEEIGHASTTKPRTTSENPQEASENIMIDDLLDLANLDGSSTMDHAASQATISSEKKPPTDWETFVAACQSGDLPKVKELISSGAVLATDSCEEGITGLHWAAINNRLSVVKYLVENEYSRADVNRVGGALLATPLHWACRGGLVYVVDYLLDHTDADPTLKDSQNYNALHLAVLSSNITLVSYILLRCVAGDHSIYIDDPDLISCTPLHWAAYQGDILSVNILLQYGADVTKVDKNLMTPLHWAFIRGNKYVLAALEENASDIFAKNDSGKDSFAVSNDMNCAEMWEKILIEADRDPKRNWEKKIHYVLPKSWKIVTFLTPYVVLPIILSICSFKQGYVIPKLVLLVLIVMLSVYLLQKFAFPVYMPKDPSAFQSPLLSGIFSGTAFWCVLTFFFAILPKVIFKRFFASLILAGLIVVFSYCFYKSMILNPGYVPVPADSSVIYKDVKELIALGKFDTEHFCINTFIRKPLRSKYSRVANRLVARFDHYCPWVYNDVGVRNHKVFITFVNSLLGAVVLYVLLAHKYFEIYAESMGYDSDLEDLCFLLSDQMCLGFTNNHFIYNLSMWSSLQCVWVLFLVLTQTFQIFKGLTTVEFTKLNRAMSHPSFTHSTVPRDFQGEAGTTSDSPAPETASPQGHSHKDGTLVCMKLLGLDQFVMTIKVALTSLFVQTTNNHQYSTIEDIVIPTDFGWKQNWLDFWFLGEIEWRNLFYLPIDGENNLNGKVVDYYKLYEYPTKHAGVDAV